MYVHEDVRKWTVAALWPFLVEVRKMDNIVYSTSECFQISKNYTVPPLLRAGEDFGCVLPLFLLWLFLLLPVALTERSRTSLALKKATRNGCLDWGPFLPMMPADFMLMLLPENQTDVCIRLQRSTLDKQLWFSHENLFLGGKITTTKLFMTVSVGHTDTVVIVYMSEWEE